MLGERGEVGKITVIWWLKLTHVSGYIVDVVNDGCRDALLPSEAGNRYLTLQCSVGVGRQFAGLLSIFRIRLPTKKASMAALE